MREFHQKNKKIPRAAHTEKKEATSSSLCSALEKENGQPLGSAEASLRAAGDGRQDPVAGSRPGESIDELAGTRQCPTGRL